MSAPWQFSVTKPRMIQLVCCLGVIQVLLYSAGVATGILVGPRAPGVSQQIRPVRAPVAEKGGAPALSAKIAPGKPGPREPVTPTPQAPVISNRQTPTVPNRQPAAPAVPAAIGAWQTSSTLDVQVASFHNKENALRLADILNRRGFGPVTVGQYDGRSETWHFVRLGPFREWDEASRVAAELERSYDLRAYVRPAEAADN